MKKGLIILVFLGVVFSLPHLVYATEWNVCPTDSTSATCSHKGPAGLQQAVNESKDGDTITIQAGMYSGTQAVPFNGTDTNSTCFINLGQRKLTLRGVGSAVLFGEGHDKPDTYGSRAGICGEGNDVTIDNVRVKEFQGGGLHFSNSRLILKNSIIEGNDSGATHFNNTSILAINNYFVANIGIQPKGLASIKAFNNIFYGSKAINADCHKDLPPIDFVNNVVVEGELTLGAGWITGDCPETAAQFKTKHITYNVIWKDGRDCYDNHEYCDWEKADNANKNIGADPLLDVPAIDERGWRWGGNFSPKEGSPVVGASDPNIPGIKNIGTSGGPCVEGNSSMCSDFIKKNPLPDLPQANNNLLPGGEDNNPPENILANNNNAPAENDTTTIHNYKIVTQLNKGEDQTGGFFLYVLFAAVYLMTIHLAIAIGDQFNIFLMIGLFALGGVVGFFLQSYALGFVLAIVLSLMFW